MTLAQSISQIVTFKNSEGTPVRATLLKVSPEELVIEVYNPYSIVQLSEVLTEVELRQNTHRIYHGRAVVTGLVNTGLMLVVSTTLLDPWEGLTDTKTPSDIKNAIKAFIENWQKEQQLEPKVQLSTIKTQSFLAEINRWLEWSYAQQENDETISEKETQLHYEELCKAISPLFHKLFKRLEKLGQKLTPAEFAIHRAFIQRCLHPLLMQSPFVHRVFNKPLGYAGDYEMINMIQRNPAEGKTMFAKLINTFYLQAPIPNSVKYRTDTLVQYLEKATNTPPKEKNERTAISIGCGPALEIQKLLQEKTNLKQCTIDLLDFNEETINYAKSKIEPLINNENKAQISFIHQSVHTLLKQRTTETTETPKQGHYRFVYCSGLFDYLSDKVCHRLLKIFFNWLAPGGTLLVTNMHPSDPHQFNMKAILEWHLIYRDKNRMRQLLSPHMKNTKLFTDQTGVNICLEIKKHES